jgi:hypothetical protein
MCFCTAAGRHAATESVALFFHPEAAEPRALFWFGVLSHLFDTVKLFDIQMSSRLRVSSRK